MNNKAIASLLTAAALGVFALGAAHADINPVAPGTPTITPVAAGYAYTYPIVLTSTETLVTGNEFTFFDVNGLVAGSEVAPSTDWTASSALLGPIATGSFSSSPTVDSPSLYNVTFTYAGPTVVGSPTDLGTFGFTSIYALANTPESFSAVAEQSGGTILNSNATTYIGPTVSATTVPEPATVVPFILGGLGLLALIVRKNRRTSSVTA